MLVQLWFDTWMRSAVDGELLVSNNVLFLGQVFIDLRFLGTVSRVSSKDAWPWVLLPVKRGIWVAFTFHCIVS